MPKSKLTAVDAVQYFVKENKAKKVYVVGINFLIPIPKDVNRLIFDTAQLKECVKRIEELEKAGFRAWTEINE